MVESVNLDDNELINTLQEKFNVIYNQKNELINDITCNPYTQLFIYTKNSVIMGLIHINNIYDRYEINNIYVLPEYRNMGIASQLLEKVVLNGKKEKIINITLEVRNDNYPALCLYKKFGFVDKAIRKGYYNGIDAILMEKTY